MILERGNDSAAPGATTTTRAWPSTFRRCGTSCRSHPTPTGPGCSPRPELHRYLRDTARQLGLYTTCEPTPKSYSRSGTTPPGSGVWSSDRPAVTARFVISSVGGYVNAKLPWTSTE